MLVSGKVNVHVPTWFVICFLEFDRIVLSSRFEEEMSFSTIGSMYGVFIFIYIYHTNQPNASKYIIYKGSYGSRMKSCRKIENSECLKILRAIFPWGKKRSLH